MNTTKYIIQTKDLRYVYGDGTEALKGVSVNIERGKITALLGGNGAGKSTLFLHLNGINRPLSGHVLYNGEPVDYSRKTLRTLKQNVGLVFQDPDSQLFSASVYQDVSFGPMNMGLPKEEVIRRVDEAICLVGIENLRDRPTHALSYGQKKRVAIAGIIAMRPSVIVLDEPTAGLDPRSMTDLMKLLLHLKNELNLSVVIATHDIDIVPLYCDYVYAMEDGNVVVEGTPEEVFEQRSELRRINLRLPRIGHLMEILREKDHLGFDHIPVTLSDARRLIKRIFENAGLK
jgi:cobalt/nickel transport system ATP-binding protein